MHDRADPVLDLAAPPCRVALENTVPDPTDQATSKLHIAARSG